MIRKSSRSLVPKKSFDEYLCIDQIILDNHSLPNRNISESTTARVKIRPSKDKAIDIAKSDLFELKYLLDQQASSSIATNKEMPLIHRFNQCKNQLCETNYQEILISGSTFINRNNIYEFCCNNYISTLETLIEIDAINLIKRILTKSDDIWSLRPSKISDEIEHNSKRPLSKSAKRVIECLVIGFTNEILINTQKNSIGNLNGFIGGEIVKNKILSRKKPDVSTKFDEEYDVEIESNGIKYEKNHYNQISIKNKFNRSECDIPVAWRVPINPMKYVTTNSNTFTMLNDN